MAALVIATLVSTGAFAQGKGRGQDKRPDKKPVKVIDGKRGGSRPPEPPPKPPKGRGGKKPYMRLNSEDQLAEASSLRPPYLLADKHCGEQRNGQFMMTRDRVTLTGAFFSWTSHDVCQWTVGLNEVEVGRCDVRQWIAEITHQGHAF